MEKTRIYNGDWTTNLTKTFFTNTNYLYPQKFAKDF